MVKTNAFFYGISKNIKKENKGSVEFQICNFTNKIRKLTLHLKLHRKDYLSKRSLLKIIGKRQRLLIYLAKKDQVYYKELISYLNIRKQTKLLN